MAQRGRTAQHGLLQLKKRLRPADSERCTASTALTSSVRKRASSSSTQRGLSLDRASSQAAGTQRPSSNRKVATWTSAYLRGSSYSLKITIASVNREQDVWWTSPEAGDPFLSGASRPARQSTRQSVARLAALARRCSYTYECGPDCISEYFNVNAKVVHIHCKQHPVILKIPCSPTLHFMTPFLCGWG